LLPWVQPDDRTKTIDLKQVNRVVLQPHPREREAP
jgi:hypothetical protein